MQTSINAEPNIINLTRDTLKQEIDKIDEVYLELLYKIISAFKPSVEEYQDSWQSFIDSTYGSFVDDPIERPSQGQYEQRELFE